MSAVDDVITKYAEILQKIYDDQTAGDHTFQGVLAEFSWEFQPARRQDATERINANWLTEEK